MSKGFLFWASTLTASLTLNGLCARALSLRGISYGDSLVSRGLSCLALVIWFAQRERLSLLPKSVKTQVLRALLAGLALTFFVASYDWLTASTVAVLSNVDVPLLIVFGPLVGIAARRHVRLLSLASISFLVWYVITLESRAHLAYGLTILGLAVVLLCFGYLFIKKSMTEENEAITILTPSLAILAYGLVQHFIGAPSTTAWTPFLIGIAFLAGATMFGAYYATMRLYEVTDLASAEFPTLISSLFIQPLETWLLGSPLEANYLLSSGGFVLMTYLILRVHYRAEAAHA